MKKTQSPSLLKRVGIIAALSITTLQAQAFCGFYVAKADTELFNNSSKVVLVRDEDKTVVTMASDYEGEPKDFAMVVPVPEVLEEGQIHIGDNSIVDHLDAYTAPRLVEYFDNNPCQQHIMYDMMKRSGPAIEMIAESAVAEAKSLGVTIEAQYTIGEYDILILSAKESAGLQTWLDSEGYQVPAKAQKVLGSYIKQDMKFFVAKVNLQEHAKLGDNYLRPIQVAYESEKFMLPIRLGTVNAKTTQDLFLFALTRKGRVETTNYRTKKIPTDMDIPLYVKDEFGDFYTAMFDTAAKNDRNVVFLEYAWDMNWCDPCAADPLSHKQLRELGVFWLQDSGTPPNVSSGMPSPQPRIMPNSMARDVFVTRLHARYSADTFPEDLMLQETGDRKNFQGRYVMRHPYKGDDLTCEAGEEYLASLPKRYEKEAQTLANITSWDINEIRKKMDEKGQSFVKPEPPKKKKWWERIWG